MFGQPVQPQVTPFREFPDGIFLVRKRSTKIPVADHYGVLVNGEPLVAFGVPPYNPVIIHRTPDIRAEWADNTGIWEAVDEVPSDQTQSVVNRASEAFNDPNYYVLTNNCEHTARYITSGEKKSTQVEWLIVGGLAALVWLVSQGDS